MKRWLIVAVLILILAGGFAAGWAVWHKNDTNNKSTQTSDPSESGKYLYIKEWGVRFRLPADFQGKVIYVTKNNTDVSLPYPDSSRPTTEGDVAYLTTKELSLLPNSNCQLNQPNGQHGGKIYLFRSTQSNQPYAQTDVKLAGHNYVTIKGDGLCSPNSNAPVENTFTSQIINAVRSLEAVRSN